MNECSEGGKIKEVLILSLKPYLYETVNGKRKRVPVMEVKDGIVTKIKDRGINKAFKATL